MRSSSATRQVVKPPDKGSFPLDKAGQCKPLVDELLACLKENSHVSMPCKHLSKAYLECRMDKGLMQAEDLGSLGFRSDDMATVKDDAAEDSGTKESRGFVAGLQVKRKA